MLQSFLAVMGGGAMAGMMRGKIRSGLISMVFANFLLAVSALFVTTSTGGCAEADDSTYQEKAAMRNEIIAYVKSEIDSGKKGSQIDVVHVVEKYIKSGENYDSAKEILLKNGFSVYEYSIEDAMKRKDIKITYRMGASYKVEQGWWYRRDIQIFLGKSPQSEKIDQIIAKVNFKTI
ncbi:MAG: hypothetical protein LBE62_09825 [Azonexus sp.]|jgi:hypothetical protein|nr:hypothetical protein [Azonexus sp.]